MPARHGTPQGIPVSPADQAARQLDQTLRQLVSVVSEQTALAKAALPQFWSAAELRKRWNCSEEKLSDLLEIHAGIVGERGHRTSVSLDDVLRIDVALKTEYDVRKHITAQREAAHA